MEKGYVLCRITLCLLIGVAGSGKTHVKHLLLGLPPPELRQSTPLFESPIRAISLSRATYTKTSSSSLWKFVSFDELDQMVIDSIKVRPSTQSRDISVDRVYFHEVGLPGGLRVTKSTLESEASDSAIAMPSTIPSPTHHEATTSRPAENMKDLPLSDLESELVELVSKASGSQQLFEVDWVYLLDSGGQPQFQRLLPAFVKHASAVLTVTKLNESLSHRPTVEYYDGSGQSCGKPYILALSNEEILMRNFRIMESRHSGLLDKKDPSVFVIGTHMDLESSSDQPEPRSSKNSSLVTMLRPLFGKKLGFYNLSQDEVIFPVNAKQPGSADQEVAEKLRELVMNMSKEDPVKIPLPWWVLDQFLRKLASRTGLKVLSLHECQHIGRRLGMNPQACHAALVFLSKLNILFYDPEFLPGVVFLTSQVLVGMVTVLVYQSHVLQGGEALVGSGEWLNFREYGLLTEKLLSCKEFEDQYRPEVFSPKDFLHLLKGLNLVARLNDEEYMMPCLLPDLPLSRADEYRQLDPSSPVVPLLVQYPERWFPAGIFPLTVAFLRNKAHWKLMLRNCKPVLFCCNCAKFNLPSGRRGTVTLLDSFKYMEVHIRSISPKACHVACQEIVQDIFRGLERATEILRYGEMHPEKVFFCPERGPDCEESPHPATISDDEWVCSVNPEVGGPLTEQQGIWPWLDGKME